MSLGGSEYPLRSGKGRQVSMSEQEAQFENDLSQSRCFLKYRHFVACSSNSNGSCQAAKTSSDDCHVKDWLGHDGPEGAVDAEERQVEKREYRAYWQHLRQPCLLIC